MCSIIGTPNNHHFPFGTNGKVVVLGVPILKHFRVHYLIVTTVCLPVPGDYPGALASGLPPVQVDKPWYNFFIPPSSVSTLLSIKYFVHKFAISGKDGIILKERPGRVAQSVGHLTCKKYVHEVLVNRLGGLSLPRKSVVRLTDRPDMTLDVYRGRKTTMQQQQQSKRKSFSF